MMGHITKRLTISVTLNQQQPWPGMRVFTEENRAFFFGRDQEVKDIARMIRHESLTILFGKSGLGKSSILRAGVSPELLKSGFSPVYIRLNHHEETLPLEDQVEVFMEEVIKSNNIDAPQPIRKETLWEYFHKKNNDWWDQDNELLKPVLIFDQFEEILTVGHENPLRIKRCNNFLVELEDLIENRPPIALQKRFKQEKGLAKQYDLEATDYRVLISLREDYLADFESLRERLRLIMTNRYRLLPMNCDQALNVIIKPAGHLVDKNIANQIINSISGSQDLSCSKEEKKSQMTQKIEPCLLSVILRELNNHRIRQGEDKISSALVKNKRPEDILSEFYESALKGFDKKIHHFIEQQLLTARGARNRIAEEDAIGKYAVSKKDIAILIDRRIIQRDKIAQTTWLELSHDTLAPVVKKHANDHSKQRKFRRRFLIVIVVATLMALMGIGISIYQIKKRETQVEEASKVALELATELENNSNMPILGKQQLMSVLQDNFDELVDFVVNSNLLKLRNAEFLVINTNMQLDAGYYQQVEQLTKAAEKLLRKHDEFKDQASPEFSATLARLRLSDAESFYHKANFKEVNDELKHVEKAVEKYATAENEIEFKSIEQRMNRIKVQLLISQGKLIEAVTLLNNTQKAIREILELTSKNLTYKIKRHISIELLKLNTLKHGVVDFFDIGDYYDEFSNDLKEVRSLLTEDYQRQWQYYNAYSFLIKSDKYSSEGTVSKARAALDEAIDLYVELVRRNSNNLRYRYSLGKALLSRARFAEKNDALQARIDINAARSIAYTLRRDTPHPYLPFFLSTDVEIVALHMKSDSKEIEAAYDRSIAKTKVYQTEFKTEHWLDKSIYLANYYKMKALSSLKNEDRTREILSLLQKSLMLVNKMQKNGADRISLAKKRYLLYSVILAPNITDKLDTVQWEDYLNKTKQQMDIINSNVNIAKRWIVSNSWLLSEMGRFHKAHKRHEEAIQRFSNMVKFGIEQVILNPNNKILFTNTIWGITQLINIHRNQDQWQQAIMSAKLLLQIYDPEKENQNSKFSEDKLRYWNDSHKAILNLKTDLDKAIVTNELNELRRQVNEILEISSMAKRKLANTSINLSQDTSNVTYDIKSLSIDQVVNKVDNMYVANKALGWKTAPIYNAPWSYTLVGEQAAVYSEVLNIQVIRVRVTKLPFYKTGQLLTIEYSDKGKYSQIGYYLESIEKKKHYKLDGTFFTISEANTAFPIQLNNIDEVAAYLRFFTTFVQTEMGSFQLVESNSEINWLQGAVVEEKKRVANLLRPVFIWPSDNTENWFATASSSYSNAIYHVKFKIHKTGVMEILEENKVASNLAIGSFKIEEKSGRSNHFIHEFTLDLLDGISLKYLSDEIKQLNVILDDFENKDVAHKESILSEIMLLELVNEDDISFNTYQEIQMFLTKQPKNSHIKNRKQASNIINSIVEQAKNKIDEKKEELPFPVDKLVNEYLNLSFYQLFASDFHGALKSSEKASELDENRISPYTNYAHALLFLDRIDEAFIIYQRYRGKRIQECNLEETILVDFDLHESVGIANSQNQGKEDQDCSWEEAILDDFDQLESVGISHPQFVNIRKEFSKNKSTED